MDVVRVQRPILERVPGVPRLLQVAIGEGVLVDDEDPAPRQILEVRLQRGRVHRDEDVRSVARGENVVIGEVELEARHARQRARRSPDLCRKIGESGQVVSEQRGL